MVELMSIYGIDKVRGGSYSSSRLSVHDVATLKKQIIHADNRCFKCGTAGHFASRCKSSRSFSSSSSVGSSSGSSSSIGSSSNSPRLCLRKFTRDTVTAVSLSDPQRTGYYHWWNLEQPLAFQTGPVSLKSPYDCLLYTSDAADE